MVDVFIIGLLSGFTTHFINYCIGKPGSKEFSPYEIFSSYTVWLAKRRLIKFALMREYDAQYKDNIVRLADKGWVGKAEMSQLNNDYKKMLYEAAEPYFTWERAVGMCPVCTGFWVSLIIGICAVNTNIVYLGCIIVISHVTIRLLGKWI